MTALHSGPTSFGAVPVPSVSSPPVPSPPVPSPSVPLRVVPSRRSPGPLAAPTDLVEPGDPTVGRLLVDTRHSVLSPHLRGRPITVTVDGRRCTCAWGRAVIDLPPGRHHVEVDAEGWGHVSEDVPVAAGHLVEVFYRAPVLPGAAGALGPAPQPGSAGRVVLASVAALTTVVAALLMAVALVVAVVSG